MKLNRACCRICIFVLMASSVTAQSAYAGHPEGNSAETPEDSPPPYSQQDSQQSAQPDTSPGSDSMGASAGSPSVSLPQQNIAPQELLAAPVSNPTLVINESLPAVIPADQQDFLLEAIESNLRKIQTARPRYNSKWPSETESLSSFSLFSLTSKSQVEMNDPNSDSVIYDKVVHEIANRWIRAGQIALDILALNERLARLRINVPEQKEYLPIQEAYLTAIHLEVLNLVSEFALSNSQLMAFILRCRTIECATEITQVQIELIKYGRFINKKKHPFDEKEIHPLILKSLDLVQQTLKSDPPVPHSKYQLAFSKVLDLFRVDLDAILDSVAEKTGSGATHVQNEPSLNLTARLSAFSGKPLSESVLPHLSERIIKEQLKNTEELKTEALSRINHPLSPSQQPTLGASSLSPLVADGKLRTNPEPPDNPAYESIHLRLRTAEESNKSYTEVEFVGFTDIFPNHASKADSSVYTAAVEETGKIFIQATQTIIDILTQTGQLGKLPQDKTKTAKEMAETYQSIAPMFLTLFQRLSLSEDRLINLMKQCTTSECVLGLAHAQTQLIEYGRSINKEKHKFVATQIHPLILRALEEVYYQNTVQAKSASPSSYQKLFNTVLNIFRSDFALLPATQIEEKDLRSSPLMSLLNQGLNQKNPFSGERVPHVSDPEIIAHLRYIEKIKNDVSSHINNGTPLSKITNNTKYYTHILHCGNTGPFDGGHMVVFGINELVCHTNHGEALYVSLYGIGPGFAWLKGTEGVLFIQSPSPITPRGKWFGFQGELALLVGGQFISAIGKNGSLLEGFIFNFGGSAVAALSLIVIK